MPKHPHVIFVLDTESIQIFKTWYNVLINPIISIEELTADFIRRGGKINQYYLRNWNKNKHTLVYLNGWFEGKNIRQAILKALG